MLAQAPYELDPELAPWKSNARFPEWTEDHIRILVVDTKTEMDQLDSEISKTRALLASLLDRHNQKAERLAFLRGAISPLKQIPSEILGEIFVFYGEGKPVVLPPNYYSSQPRYPWTLGQVSSYWRKVLWNTPDVWRNLEVGSIYSEDDMTIDAALDIFSRVDEGLSLSTRGEVDYNNPVCPLILGFVERIRHLAIEPTHDFRFAFLGLPSGSLDALESIEMKFNAHWNVFPTPGTTALHTARRLTKVAFEFKGHLTKTCPPELLLLPWGQLTEISFTNLSLPYDTAHSVLSQCRNLISCTLEVENIHQYLSAEPFSKDVVLPVLRSFTIIVRGHIRFDWATFLRPLVIPSLKDLDISVADELDDETFISFLTRSRCTLETLAWSTSCARQIEPEELYLVFSQLASIQELTIPQHCLPPPVFKALSRNQWLPKIKRLVCGVEPSGFQAFADMVEDFVRQSSGKMESASLACCTRDGLAEAFERYTALNPGWKASGRIITFEYVDFLGEDDILLF